MLCNPPVVVLIAASAAAPPPAELPPLANPPAGTRHLLHRRNRRNRDSDIEPVGLQIHLPRAVRWNEVALRPGSPKEAPLPLHLRFIVERGSAPGSRGQQNAPGPPKERDPGGGIPISPRLAKERAGTG
ncbi:hypothetical protein MUK42_20580 [Musa troglodytarum]|uniref:Uncharacterized protein n=1 Tax=Musa troglodytarum TaxID=320322 RepID=A0A9E7FX30_9LILI|nr:hypothetical protein MUK42_20580 [Musa troglodytarum]